MDQTIAANGRLFSWDFLTESIQDFPEWDNLSAVAVEEFQEGIQTIFRNFPTARRSNESQTEDDLIWPILKKLGWFHSLRQQNLSTKGREDIPDGILFGSADAKKIANAYENDWQRYRCGCVVVESKRWGRPLDRRSGHIGEDTAPSTQMLRYMRRIDIVTNGELRWGILTNGLVWRLYYSGVKSVSEEFFEISIANILGFSPASHGVDDEIVLTDGRRQYWLKVFYLIFRQDAFQRGDPIPLTFHERALEHGKFYEKRVADDLSNKVFERVFPELVRTIAVAAPQAELRDVQQSALILLYRLLFILYAEDRDLLPTKDPRYNEYGLRNRVRLDIKERKDKGEVFSEQAARYWAAVDDLCMAIDGGDVSIGLPPYDGGLFDRERNLLLTRIRIHDATMADVIDALSFENTSDGRKYINYRNLSVRHLGSIYERLLEYEVKRPNDDIVIVPNIYARKLSGSYYTPDDLVELILTETLTPLIESRKQRFKRKVEEFEQSNYQDDHKLGQIKLLDPATNLLDLKICDPAMGSGHFLVSLIDFLADQILDTMAEVERWVPKEWGYYNSPLVERIETIRNRILSNAELSNWKIDSKQLDDRHIICRMVLKRCVYGVDKNPMAVELAKVALWLHTFTTGAPLTFLDHHLRCGDSLFGLWVKEGISAAENFGSPLLLHKPMRQAVRAAAKMQLVAGLSDAEIAEAHRSAEVFDEVKEMTEPLDAILKLIFATSWLPLSTKEKKLIKVFFDGQFGNALEIALNRIEPSFNHKQEGHFDTVLREANAVIAEERFLNWQVTFPEIWSDWDADGLTGGFDAIIGNPPWDRMKLQQIEWFAERHSEIALASPASERRSMIDALKKSDDPLANDYTKVSFRAATAARLARTGDNFPLLSSGDINLYSLFVERALTLTAPDGMVGLLVPSGIASDKHAAKFFKSISTSGRLKALYDFENGRKGEAGGPFFPDVDRRFKFCTFVASSSPSNKPAKCAFFLNDVSDLSKKDAQFLLSSADFTQVNPNTGTAPIFRSRRDAELTKAIYSTSPILIDRSSKEERNIWSLRYRKTLHMTTDSHLFRTRYDLEEKELAFPIGSNLFESKSELWVPIYEGKMVQAYDHRAASIINNPKNRHRPAQKVSTTTEQYQNPDWLPHPQFWVNKGGIRNEQKVSWCIGYKAITAPTNMRTMIASILPFDCAGNSIALVQPIEGSDLLMSSATLFLGMLNSTPFDYVIRQKVQGQNINQYIVEQVPVIPSERFDEVTFGSKTARDIVHDAVLELTYTSHDMAPFARAMGFVDQEGKTKSPFLWNDDKRIALRSKIDAVFFHLYGVTEREDIRYIYSTFPIVEKTERRKFADKYRSRDICLAYLNAFTSGNSDVEIDL